MGYTGDNIQVKAKACRKVTKLPQNISAYEPYMEPKTQEKGMCFYKGFA